MVWCHEMVDPLLYNCPVFCRISLVSRLLRLNSLFLYSPVRLLTLVVVDSLFEDE